MVATMKERTKVLFAENLIEMLKETPFDKIRVIELAKRSGTTAQTFYYHFRDKYELVAWMYLKDFSDVVGHQEAEYSAERLAAIMQKMDDKRSFYKKVFSADTQNSISSYVRVLSLKLAKEALEEAGVQVSAEQELAIRYHAYGIMGLLQEWIFSDDPMDTLILAEFMYQKTPDFLKTSFEQVQYKSDEIMSSKL